MISGSIISIFSAIVSIVAISISLNIFNKVFQEDYKKPWLFIAIAALILGISQLLRFLNGIFYINIVNSLLTEYLIFILDFIAIIILTYGLLLEYLILIYYKGKFVKMKFIPVQEKKIGGELDINVIQGESYVCIKKEKNFMHEQFAEATKKGYEGFLITQDNPRMIREKYNIEKTPIAWINQLDGMGKESVRKYLDENSDVVEPMQLNNLISFIDNFLEQSQSPFIMIDLDLLLSSNNFIVVEEFIKYIKSRISRFNGIFICLINSDYLSREKSSMLEEVLKEIE